MFFLSDCASILSFYVMFLHLRDNSSVVQYTYGTRFSGHSQFVCIYLFDTKPWFAAKKPQALIWVGELPVLYLRNFELEAQEE